MIRCRVSGSSLALISWAVTVLLARVKSDLRVLLLSSRLFVLFTIFQASQVMCTTSLAKESAFAISRAAPHHISATTPRTKRGVIITRTLPLDTEPGFLAFTE